MRFLIDSVERLVADRAAPFWKYYPRLWALTFFPALAVGVVVHLACETRPSPMPDIPAIFEFALCAIAAPLIETLMMIPIFWLLKRFTRDFSVLALSSAATWATLHSLDWAPWGLIVFWPFVVFSINYLVWERTSKLQAYARTALLHGLHNFIPACMVAF